MSIVMSESLVLRSRHWSVDDLEELPMDDGHRYEIIDGVLDSAFAATKPFPVRVVPADLVR